LYILQKEVLRGAKFANATLKTRQNNEKIPGLNDILHGNTSADELMTYLDAKIGMKNS
jgi:hypothetical protein